VRLRAAAIVRLEGALAHDRTPYLASARAAHADEPRRLGRPRPGGGRFTANCVCSNDVTVRIGRAAGQTGPRAARRSAAQPDTVRSPRRHPTTTRRFLLSAWRTAVRFARRWADPKVRAASRDVPEACPYTGCGQVCGRDLHRPP
jgi:hypothetical protein